MASKALTCSVSSAPLVSSSSSGARALCFAPGSLSFPAKNKISPLVGVVRAQGKVINSNVSVNIRINRSKDPSLSTPATVSEEGSGVIEVASDAVDSPSSGQYKLPAISVPMGADAIAELDLDVTIAGDKVKVTPKEWKVISGGEERGPDDTTIDLPSEPLETDGQT